MAVFVIGDIHGSFVALETLLNKLLEKGKRHTYIFLGDYVNKGPESKKVVDYLILFSKTNHCVFLRGNHDILMLIARFGIPDYKNWIQLGGDKTLESYHAQSKLWYRIIPGEHWSFLEDTLPYYELGNNIFVHAGLEEGKKLEKQKPQILFWNKNTMPVRYKKDKAVFCGHTVQKNGEIGNFGHTILLDTFAWKDGWLTALNVKKGVYFQTNNSGELRKGKIELQAKKNKLSRFWLR